MAWGLAMAAGVGSTNRTIVELKHIDGTNYTGLKSTTNRTIVELKPDQYGNRVARSELPIVP